MLSFNNKKNLRFVITLGTGKFDEKGSDQIILQGFRAMTEIENAGGIQMGMLRARVMGVSQSDMNLVTSYPLNIGTQTQNTIVVYAIDGNIETIVFAGNIVKAWGDYSTMPDVGLVIQAQAAMSSAVTAVPPRSFKGGSDVADIMRQIANSMGYAFENSGVSVIMSDVYLANTDLEQVRELAKSAGIEFNIDRNIFSIWMKGSYRNSSIPLVSKNTGLVGYPMFDGTYLRLSTLYNPAIISGGLVLVESDNKPARGQWQVLSMTHRLESEKPNGNWFSEITAVALDYYGTR